MNRLWYLCYTFAIQDWNTSLYWAANEGHTEIVLLLLQSGGNPNIANKVIYSIIFQRCFKWFNLIVFIT